MNLNEDEKLSILEWKLADHDGLSEKKEYRICKNLMTKIESYEVR
jgi:hypothetical protein